MRIMYIFVEVDCKHIGLILDSQLCCLKFAWILINQKKATESTGRIAKDRIPKYINM